MKYYYEPQMCGKAKWSMNQEQTLLCCFLFRHKKRIGGNVQSHTDTNYGLIFFYTSSTTSPRSFHGTTLKLVG